MPFFVSLLVSNVLQAIGTLFNIKWVNDRTVSEGQLCTVQGGIKQAGNLGMALWYVFILRRNLVCIILCALSWRFVDVRLLRATLKLALCSHATKPMHVAARCS